MESFDFEIEREFNPLVHVEKKLGFYDQGDVSIACWEPGQVSPNHCHPEAVEIYFCYEGGGIMRTENEELEIKKVVLLCIQKVSCTNSRPGKTEQYYSVFVMGNRWFHALKTGPQTLRGRQLHRI